MASTIIELKNKWHLGEQMGQGGFGRIYDAQGDDGSSAVVKLVPKVPEAARELLFEPISDKANIIPILDTGEWEEFYVIVMPRAEKSLREHMNASAQPMAVGDVVPILIDVAEALAGLQGNVVHRDLKPENVLLYQSRWCLADFGIARYAEATTAPDTHKYSKTAQYAAPEQWREERATPATDVYAFGVMAFELFQGRRPFLGPTGPDFRTQHLTQPSPPLTETSPPLASLVAECLRKAAGTRPTSENVLERLRRNQQPLTPGVGKLQAANQRIVQEQSIADAEEAGKRTVREQRAELFSAAKESFTVILQQMLTRIRQEAPTAHVEKGSYLAVRLGKGSLGIDLIEDAPENCLARYGNHAPFDVVAYTDITVRNPRNSYDYEGRSHSLWFCDAHDAGVYRWFETAFMVMPLVQERYTIEPFALDPTDEGAGAAFANVISHRQVAWQPLPFDQGEEEQFIDRWISWLADASTGSLQHPSTMPEKSGGHFR